MNEVFRENNCFEKLNKVFTKIRISFSLKKAQKEVRKN